MTPLTMGMACLFLPVLGPLWFDYGPSIVLELRNNGLQ